VPVEGVEVVGKEADGVTAICTLELDEFIVGAPVILS